MKRYPIYAIFANSMQLIAYHQSGLLCNSRQAEKKIDYFCPECGSIVHLREGEIRRPHFYHLHLTSSCRQNGKGLPHLNLQFYLQDRLPKGEVDLEYRFNQINRIADVVWHQERLIFEIQCSPLSKEEMQERVSDYKSLGYTVIWILHDSRYNKWRLQAIELGLQEIPHYFSNMTDEGKGMIYDQFALIEKGRRKNVLPRLPIDLTAPYRKKTALRNWGIGFEGDVDSLEENHPYLIKIQENKKPLPEIKAIDWKEKIDSCFKSFMKYFLKPYCE